ncbi:hypothetical protein BXZ70DRAFT_711149 [Cristinia sonorae]|uniref:Uncharacterized protein n=1 Tax=Cristinia sonorae TaxID=1940300 RepID=A0A8K0XK58_9AGAR|nr:hypothetical protein BXZ70DRAFT_711149 [Cristinia sonorae]
MPILDDPSPRRPAPPSRQSKRPAAATLPTPPPTKHSRKRKRSASPSRRKGRDVDSDSDADDHRAHAAGDTRVSHKRRKTLRLDALAAELTGQVSAEAAEEAFWADSLPGDKSSSAQAKASKASETSRGRSLSRSPTRSPSSSPPARLLRRNNTGLFSPPPSRRHPAPVVALPVTPPPLPRTPRAGRSLKRKLFPERDSPNNPFLVPDDSPEALSSPDVGSRTPTPLPYVEKPTITYVFRGVKAEFKNPLHDPSNPTGVPDLEPGDPSTLPVSDREFSPDPYCPPKLLFPEARKLDHARLRKRKAPATARSRSGSDEPEKRPVAGPSTPKRPSTPPSQTAKGRSRSRSAAKSEWDTSDEEDEAPQAARRSRKHRPDLAGVEPRFPVAGLPAVREEVSAEDEEEVEEQLMQMPKADLKRIAKIAPLLLDATTAGER